MAYNYELVEAVFLISSTLNTQPTEISLFQSPSSGSALLSAWLHSMFSSLLHTTPVWTRFPSTTLKRREPRPLRLPIRRKHGAFLDPLCLRSGLSRNSCGAWVREAWACAQPQTAPHWLPTWRKERCLGTLPGPQKQTPLFLALTRFSSSYFPSAAVSFFACAAPFPTMQEHFLPFCHQGRYEPCPPRESRPIKQWVVSPFNAFFFFPMAAHM